MDFGHRNKWCSRSYIKTNFGPINYDMKKRYYFFNIEIALRKADDLNIYAYENVSHIPTSKLIEIFNINTEKDPYLLEGYFLTKTNYKKYKKIY
jgi:hypothetical protein